MRLLGPRALVEDGPGSVGDGRLAALTRATAGSIVAGGAAEIQRRVIARQGLGARREHGGRARPAPTRRASSRPPSRRSSGGTPRPTRGGRARPRPTRIPTLERCAARGGLARARPRREPAPPGRPRRRGARPRPRVAGAGRRPPRRSTARWDGSHATRATARPLVEPRAGRLVPTRAEAAVAAAVHGRARGGARGERRAARTVAPRRGAAFAWPPGAPLRRATSPGSPEEALRLALEHAHSRRAFGGPLARSSPFSRCSPTLRRSPTGSPSSARTRPAPTRRTRRARPRGRGRRASGRRSACR